MDYALTKTLPNLGRMESTAVAAANDDYYYYYYYYYYDGSGSMI
jgi:hypothetical protein